MTLFFGINFGVLQKIGSHPNDPKWVIDLVSEFADPGFKFYDMLVEGLLIPLLLGHTISLVFGLIKKDRFFGFHDGDNCLNQNVDVRELIQRVICDSSRELILSFLVEIS